VLQTDKFSRDGLKKEEPTNKEEEVHVGDED